MKEPRRNKKVLFTGKVTHNKVVEKVKKAPQETAKDKFKDSKKADKKESKQ